GKPDRAGFLEDARAGGSGGACKPLGKSVGVEMAGAGVAPPAMIDAGADGRRKRGAVEPLNLVVAVARAQLLNVGDLARNKARLVGRLDETGTPVAGDG